MLKFVLLAFILPLCNCQLLSSLGGHQTVTLGGGTQYILIPLGAQSLGGFAAPAVSLPAPTLVRQVAPPQVIVRPQAPAIVAPPPRPVLTSLPVSDESGPSEPYTYGYQLQDEEGNTVSRQETSDGNGAVRGSYSYTDTQGLRRTVNYVADAAGYRAEVQTNEPGTANANPADVQINAEEPPAAVVAAYLNPQIRRTRA